MFKTLKNTLQIMLGIVFAVQLTGCFYWDHDRDRHHHDDHDRSSVDVNFHG